MTSEAGRDVNKIHTCTKDDPWKENMTGRCQHPKAREIGDQKDGYPGGDLVKMQCPICKVEWTMELPQ